MKFLTFCFFAILSFLILEVFLNVKDINDAWILDGLFPSFVLFVIAYIAVVSFSRNVKFVAIVASIFLAVINFIPTFKYVFIYGFKDPLNHYGFMKEIITSGHVPEIGFLKDQYGPTPGMHIFMSELSILSGLNGLISMKMFLIVFPFMIPLVVYLVTRKLNMPSSLAKLTIVSTTISPKRTYYYGGTTSVYSLFVLFICFYSLFASSGKISRSKYTLIILFGMTIVISHDVTNFFLLILTLLALLFAKLKLFKSLRSLAMLNLILIVVILSHFTLTSSINFSRLLFLIKQSFVSLFTKTQIMPLSPQGYYSTFFQLTLLDKIRVLLVGFASDAVLLFVLVLGFIAMLKLRFRDSKLVKFYQFLVLVFVIGALTFILPLFISQYIINRGLSYVSVITPFFAGLGFFYLFYSKRKSLNKVIFLTVMFALVFVPFLQIYPFQPLIPKISNSSRSYYIVDWRQVNTAYDRSLISFVAMHDLKLKITTDNIFRSQMRALANATFEDLLTWSSPLSKVKYGPLILISHPGASHIIPSGRDAVAIEQYLQRSLQENNVIYSNGEAYACLNMTIITHVPK